MKGFIMTNWRDVELSLKEALDKIEEPCELYNTIQEAIYKVQDIQDVSIEK
jgi:hypothetical protein